MRKLRHGEITSLLQITGVVSDGAGSKLRMQSPCFLSWSTLPSSMGRTQVTLSSSSYVKILTSWNLSDLLPALVTHTIAWMEPGLPVSSMPPSLIFLLISGYPAHGRSPEVWWSLWPPGAQNSSALWGDIPGVRGAESWLHTALLNTSLPGLASLIQEVSFPTDFFQLQIITRGR